MKKSFCRVNFVHLLLTIFLCVDITGNTPKEELESADMARPAAAADSKPGSESRAGRKLSRKQKQGGK